MEPLSVAASITGILAVAAKITKVVAGFVRKSKDVPDSAHKVLSELSDLTLCLKQLAPFIRGDRYADRTRQEAISVEQIVVLSTSLVLNMSELESLVDSFGIGSSISITARARWVNSEHKVLGLLTCVRASKNSLNLILTIFTWSVYQSMFDCG